MTTPAASRPKDTPLLLEKVISVRRELKIPAENLTDPAATLTEIPVLLIVPEAFVPAKAAVA